MQKVRAWKVDVERKGPYSLRLAGMPAGPAVYGFWRGTECRYIGSTVNLRQRICSHEKDFDEIVQWIEVQKHELAEVERTMFLHYQPERNRCLPGRQRPWAEIIAEKNAQNKRKMDRWKKQRRAPTKSCP